MNLISKRELLENTGISYGQLYRWKREGLIPEEWFIKRASFTGQETFLPREQALARIGAILSLKDDYSLVQIKQMLSGVNSNISQEDLEKIEELYREAADILPELAQGHVLPVNVFFAAAVCEVSEEGQAAEILRNSIEIIQQMKTEDCTVTAVLDSFGCVHAAYTQGRSKAILSSSLSVIKSVYVGDVAEELRKKYPDVFYGNKSVK